MSDDNPDRNPKDRLPANVPILHGPITPEEKTAEDERKRTDAREASENAYKDRQIKATEAANSLAYRSFAFTVVTAIAAAAACVGTWFQGCENHRSWETAQDTLTQMRIESENSGKQFQVQLSHYDDGLGRTGLLAQHAGEQVVQSTAMAKNTGIQATATQKTATAARDAARIADDSLHISQRAYLITGVPVEDIANKKSSIPIYNVGHVPSGWVRIVIHEMTAKLDPLHPTDATVAKDIIERHWMSTSYQSIPATPVGGLYAIMVRFPKASIEEITIGRQRILTVIVMTYNNGFPDSPDEKWTFCDGSEFSATTKEFMMKPCGDPEDLLRNLQIADDYPSSKYRNQEQN